MKRLFLYFQLSLIGSIVFLSDFAKADPCQSYASQAQSENARILSCVPVTIDVQESPSYAGNIGKNGTGKREDGTQIDVGKRYVFLKEISDPIVDNSKPRQTWIVTHGWNSDSNKSADGNGDLNVLAREIAAKHKGDRVIMLDWSEASKNSGGDGALTDQLSRGNYYAATWIRPVAEQVVVELKKLGIDDFDASRNLNLVGHSLGALMSGEIGKIYRDSQDKNSLIKDADRVGVNSLIALDPASESNVNETLGKIIGASGGYDGDLGGYDVDGRTPAYKLSYKREPTLLEKPRYSTTPVLVEGGTDRPAILTQFKDIARHSKAFVGKNSIAGNHEFASNANQSFQIDFGELFDARATPILGEILGGGIEHTRVINVFTKLVKNPSLFGGVFDENSKERENLDRAYDNGLVSDKHNGTLFATKNNEIERVDVTHSQLGEVSVQPNGTTIYKNPTRRGIDRLFGSVKVGGSLMEEDTVINLFPEKISNFVAYNSGDAFARAVQAQLLQNQLTGITQGQSSHIGSAAYFLGRSPANDPILEQQFSGATNSNVGENAKFPFYTSGQPLSDKVPIDIVLSWDQARTGLDLDSHLTGPATDNPNSPVRFQTYFGARGDLNTFPFALLYRDSIPDKEIDPTGLIGVEQTRIGTTQPGIYRFYVHNYSEFSDTTNGRNNGRFGLSNSGAQVQVFKSGTGIPTFDPTNPNAQSVGNPLTGTIAIPANQQGNVWYVFQLDSRTGILRPVNTFNTNIVPPNQVPAFGEPRP